MKGGANAMVKINIEKITRENITDLAGVYGEVFRGFPWYEDMVCSGVRMPIGSPERCSVQYTNRTLPQNYQERLNSDKREWVVGETSSKVKDCVVCGRDLIRFYPDFIDQRVLIKEATEKKGFIGYMLREEDNPIGFSWGYRIPSKRTSSVNFPLIVPELVSRGINPETTFYGAELGVIEERQRQGLGLLASTVRLEEARRRDYQSFLVRTKNEAVLAILRRIFSGKREVYLFDDPERKTPLFKWEFADFDLGEVERIINSFGSKE